MIKRIKKISSLIIALVFMLTLTIGSKSIHASKVEQGSITILNTQQGKEYRLYKIFDLVHNKGNISYTINNEWEEFFENEGEDYIVEEYSDDLNPIVVGGVTKYINITEYNVDEFAMTAFKYASTREPNQSVTGTGGEQTVNVGNNLGYYLVYPKGATEILEGQASIVSLTSTTPMAYVEIKSTYPDVKKEADKVTAAIGEHIEYTLTGKVPDTTGYKTYKYQLSDTLSKGLTLVKDSFEIYVDDLKIDLDSDFVVIKSTEDKEISITFDMIGLKDYVGDEIKVKYKAYLNGNAVIGKDGNENTLVLEYSNDPKNSELTDKTPPTVVKVYTGKIKILKIDGSTGSPLMGAKFILKDDEDFYYNFNHDLNKVEWVEKIEDAKEIQTDPDGYASFPGLKEGTYYITETMAPEGYNKLNEDIEIEINEEEIKTTKEITITVENNSGMELPDTGGRGKILFIAMGGAVIMIALFSIVKDKLKKERN